MAFLDHFTGFRKRWRKLFPTDRGYRIGEPGLPKFAVPLLQIDTLIPTARTTPTQDFMDGRRILRELSMRSKTPYKPPGDFGTLETPKYRWGLRKFGGSRPIGIASAHGVAKLACYQSVFQKKVWPASSGPVLASVVEIESREKF
jgi:hypothetical protein